MSRPLRIEYPGAWYHIMNRGGRYEAIFEDKIFYRDFVNESDNDDFSAIYKKRKLPATHLGVKLF